MISQLRHGHLAAQTVVEGDDLFAMAPHLEVGRVRQGFPCTRFEEQASGLAGVDEPRPKFLLLGDSVGSALALARCRARKSPESLTDVPSRSRGGPCAPASSSSNRGVSKHLLEVQQGPRWRDLANPHKGAPSTCRAGAPHRSRYTCCLCPLSPPPHYEEFVWPEIAKVIPPSCDLLTPSGDPSALFHQRANAPSRDTCQVGVIDTTP